MELVVKPVTGSEICALIASQSLLEWLTGSKARNGRMRRSGHIGWVFGTLLLTAGCQTPVGPFYDHIPEADLLSGEAILGEAITGAELADIEIVAINDDMREFVADLLEVPNRTSRFWKLLQRMRSLGNVHSSYDAYSNLTAEEVFVENRGNCLSFASLFIALARETGFDARYQLVDIPPDYDSVDGIVVLNRHINVSVNGVPGRSPVTIEFSREYANNIHDRQVVDDGFALGLHYNNLAFSRARAGDQRSALIYLRKAIEKTPHNPDLWTNLGVFYAQHGHFDQAISAYHRGLALDDNHSPAVRGLARAHEALGQHANARFFERRVAHSRVRDGYMYYILAQRAYQAEMPAESLKLVSQAIRLYRKDHRFHELQGEIHDHLGNPAEAKESYRRARILARRYESSPTAILGVQGSG